LKNRVAIIKGRILKYDIRRHPRARHRKVTVSREQGVVVTLPPRESMAGIDDLFKQWEDWLEEKVDHDGVWDGPVIRQYAGGSEVLLYGEPHRLEISALENGGKRKQIKAGAGVLKMVLPVDEIMDPGPALKGFLRKTARGDFKDRVARWSKVTGLVPSKIVVGERTTRWGSCSSQGTLSFCYRLIMAPPSVIDAIVVHELCHLRHANHGKGFWTLLESILPDYHESRTWLKTHTEQLHL
jgi:predicted metal-dependent hydrolase